MHKIITSTSPSSFSKNNLLKIYLSKISDKTKTKSNKWTEAYSLAWNITIVVSLYLIISMSISHVAHASVLGDLAATMPPGSFQELPTNWPGGNPENLLKKFASNSFQYAHNAVWDPNTRKLICKCGGAKVPGQLIIYDEASNTWSERTSPFDGHAYSHNALSSNGGGYLYSGRFGETRDFWRYDIGQDTWAKMPNAEYPSTTSVARAYAWFPELHGGSIILIDGRKGNGTYFKESTKTWHPLDMTAYKTTSPLSLYHNIAQYNSIHKIVLFGGGNNALGESSSKMYTLDEFGIVTQKSDAPFPLRVPSSDSPGGILISDPVSGKFILWNQNGRFYEYDVIVDSWTELKNISIPQEMSQNLNASRNSIGSAISTHGVILYTKYLGSSTKTWLYKHAPGGGSPVPPPPSPSVQALNETENLSPPSSSTVLTSLSSSSGGEPLNETNAVRISDTSGITQASRPVSIARPFRQGEIKNFAQAEINGTPVLTQCDVKNRWPDNSLKFAIVSFIIPSIPANGSVNVQFVNQSSGNNTGFLTQSQLLANVYNFDGTIALTDGNTKSISARAMLNAGHFRYWLKGPIATAIIIEDRTPSRNFDVDFGDGSQALHPIFEAWFYPQNKKVELGYTIENIWASSNSSKSMRDLAYNITLKSGYNNPSMEWTHPKFTHIGKTRWHKKFWLGADPKNIMVDHNLNYLITTAAIPHYDPTIKPSDSITNSLYNSYITEAKNGMLDGSNGNSNKLGIIDMPGLNGTGAAAGIGPLPKWQVMHLYKFNEKTEEMLYGMADLLGHMPLHFRDADTLAGDGKYFDASFDKYCGGNLTSGSVDTFGRIISVNARRTVATFDDLDGDTPGDAINVSDVSQGKWAGIERSHWPSIYYLPYLLSGKYYYLEGLQMQAAYAIAYKRTNCGSNWQRQGQAGLMADAQVRGEAWGMRELIYATFLSPDKEPEQAYFLDKIRNNIANWEGVHQLQPTFPSRIDIYNFGKLTLSKNQYWRFPDTNNDGIPEPSPIGQWSTGVSSKTVLPLVNAGTNPGPGALASAVSPWEEHFVCYTLGMGKQMLGDEFNTLLKSFAKQRFHIINNNIFAIDQYRWPTLIGDENKIFNNPAPTNWNWIQSIQDFMTYFQAPGNSSTGYGATQWRKGLDPDHSFRFIALTCTSFLTEYHVDGISGNTMYNKFKKEAPDQSTFSSSSPKWAITPMKETSLQSETGLLPLDEVPPNSPKNLQVVQ